MHHASVAFDIGALSLLLMNNFNPEGGNNMLDFLITQLE